MVVLIYINRNFLSPEPLLISLLLKKYNLNESEMKKLSYYNYLIIVVKKRKYYREKFIKINNRKNI